MVIKNLWLKNFQCISELQADFVGSVYLIRGENERGKSTLLKAICALLTGERDEVLKAGEKKGFAKAIIGNNGTEYEVELRFTENNPRGSLIIKNKDQGFRSENISMLNEIFGYTNFDAVEFSRWSETAEGRRKQVEAVKSLLPKEVIERISEIEAFIAERKESRKEANAEVKTYKVLTEQAAKKVDTTKTWEKMDISKIIQDKSEYEKEKNQAEIVKAKLEQRRDQLNNIDSEIEAVLENQKDEVQSIQDEMEEITRNYEAKISSMKESIEAAKKFAEEEIERIKKEEEDIRARIANAEKWLEEYQEVEDIDYDQILAKAEENNQNVALFEAYQEQLAQLNDKELIAEGIEEEIKTAMKEKQRLIDESHLPIDGLTFGEDGLELNGIPFVPGKVSDSQIMEVAVKLIIASNPKTNVFCIARGESLGNKRLQEIINVAKENGFQGFIEEVKRGQDNLTIEEYTEK